MNIKSFLTEIFNDEEIQNYKPRYPRFWRVIRNFIICCVISNILTIAYIEIGHNKGWKRADVWYTCIHTHHHFSWQK